MPQRSSKTGRRKRAPQGLTPESETPSRGQARRRQRADGPPPARGQWHSLVWIATLGLIGGAIYLAIDHQRTTSPAAAAAAAAGETLLNEMQVAYKKLDAYSDTALIQFRAPENAQADAAGKEKWIDEIATITTRFQRPNLIRLVAKRPNGRVVDVASNGKEIHTAAKDPGNNDFDRQFVQRPAPETINVRELYSATEFTAFDRPGELDTLLMLPAPLHISQLSLLVDEQPLMGLLETIKSQQKLDDAPIAGVPCHRVSVVDQRDGKFIFWIDTTTKLLRRLEFPAPEDGRGRLVCDYSQITTQPALRSEFQMPVPANANVVSNFVMPPTAVAPTGLNQPAGEFAFTNLASEPVSSATFKDKITVLCWYDSRAGNGPALEKLQSVYETNKAEETADKFQFLLVNTDPAPTVSPNQVQQQLTQWQIGIPVVRDLAAVGRDRFDIQSIPTLVVIDDKGIVQLNETGIDPQLDQQLPRVLKLIADGQPIAADYLEFLREQQVAYQQQLAASSVATPESPATNLPTRIATATNPKRLKLTELWTISDVKDPGNVYASLLPDDRTRILVHDGWQNMVELDSDGSVQRRHTIAESETSAARRMRSAIDRTGRRYYATWAMKGRQVTVFNESWQSVCTYPPADSSGNSSIQTAEITDLDGDGELELYVAISDGTDEGSDNNVGVRCVELDGTVRWKNDSIQSVKSMTRSHRKSPTSDNLLHYLLTTNRSGQIVPLDPDGNAQRPINVGVRAIHELIPSDADDPKTVYCGLTFLPTGTLAIAINSDFTDPWEDELPAGNFRDQIEFVTTADWFEDAPCWVIAGPDGSVKFVSHDGEFHDGFNTGQELTGIATYKTRGANVLILSGKRSVSAWQVKLPQL